MILIPEIKTLEAKKLVGQKFVMNLTNDRTGELWQSFLPIVNGVKHRISKEFISMRLYPQAYFNNFDPAVTFEKWAVVEVANFKDIPAPMESYILPGGLYAVFHYRGLSTDNSIFQYIYGSWLYESAYNLDNRPHFEVLGDKYKNNSPDSEEEIWVPIRNK